MGLSACSVSGDTASPFKDLPFFSDFENQGTASQSLGDYITTSYKWWQDYNDPNADQLIAQLLSQNLQLRAAAAQLLQAQEQMTIARAAILPSLSGDANAARQSIPSSANRGGFSSPRRIYTTNYDLGLSASWQLDLFGELRNEIESSRASYFASLENQQALIQSLIIQLLTTRVALATLYEQRELIEQTIQSREKTLQTINRRYELGVANNSALEVRLARENLSAAKAQKPAIDIAIKENIYALDILLGQMPNTSPEDEKYKNLTLPLPPQRLNVPPPVALLDLRPDLKRDEYRLIAAKRDINVAIANLYPSFGISGGYGYQSVELGDLISSETLAWNLLGNITQPLFEGGRLRADVRLSKARAEELAANYAQNVITAVQDVENALQQEENLRKQLQEQDITLQEAQRAYDLGKKRYEKGLLPLTSLLEIERRLLAQKQDILNTRQSIWQSRYALHLAFGGAWLNKMSTPTDEITRSYKGID